MPYNNLLVDFSVLFSRLFTRLELLNDENQFFNAWRYITPPVQLSWLTFARWVRIYEHDRFYDDKINFWKNDLKNSIRYLNSSIDKFEDKTENIFTDSSSDYNYDSFKHNMLNATVGNYLKY